MAEIWFSPSWYRVARLQPRLRCHAQIHRHHYRGQRWYILQDHAAERYHRFTPAAHYLIGLMDGRRTVQEIWELATERLGDAAPTQEEMIRLLNQLHQADVLLCDVPPNTLELFQRNTRQQRRQWLQRLASPLAIRFPFWDPERFLERWSPWVSPLFSRLGAAFWLLVVGTALLLGFSHWTDLTENMADRVLAPHNLIALALIYPVVKALHELGHAFAVKQGGGEVHELGIMLLVLMPIPYVDASAAAAFPNRYRRMLVGAAGMLVELFLAALALLVWLSVEPGVVRLIAYNVILIGTVSTLFFNGNPLLRYDAYYILADLLEIPNLGIRSNQYLGYLCQRYLFGLRDAISPVTAPGEQGWFVFYGITSLVYRLFITILIILFIAGKFFIMGVILALWAALTMTLVPLAKALRIMFTHPAIRHKRGRAMAVSSLILIGLGALLLVPLPLWTRAEGVIWLPEQSQVRAGTAGFVQELLVPPASWVRRGQPLFRCDDPLLPAQVKVLESRIRELQARYEAQWYSDRVQADITRQAQWYSDRVQADITRQELAVVQADLGRARERAQDLIVRSPLDGLFIVSQPQDLPGRFVHQGEILGYVVESGRLTVRVVVPQEAIALVRQHTQDVRVRLADRQAVTQPSVIQREVPAATEELPSPALGSSGGGPIPIKPTDAQGKKAFQPVFQLDLRLPDQPPSLPIGGRVHVRFDHGKEPLVLQWYRSLRQLFLRRFNV